MILALVVMCTLLSPCSSSENELFGVHLAQCSRSKSIVTKEYFLSSVFIKHEQCSEKMQSKQEKSLRKKGKSKGRIYDDRLHERKGKGQNKYRRERCSSQQPSCL